jgi:glycosyltransferase involved in cell wall biosynthesis
MRAEYVRNGIDPDRVLTVKLPAPPIEPPGGAPVAGVPARSAPRERSAPVRLLFMGRLDSLKGGAVLLDAAERVHRDSGLAVAVDFAGEGPDRMALEAGAARATGRSPGVTAKFHGWVNPEHKQRLFGASDLLVVPSLWPEPFGLVGIEAGLHGVPAAAFDVGGISDWLEDGVNGHLASADPPSERELAAAILASVRDPEHHRVLRRGAIEIASRFTMRAHLDQLVPILVRAAAA